jgi:hypothetical protein
MGSVVGPLWILEDGYSMQFDGTDDYISVPSFTTSGDDLTLSFWFKAVNLSTGTGAFLYKDVNNFVYYNSNEIIYCKINGTLSYIVCNVGGVPQLFNTGWHNLTITKTGTTETWYVDGVSYAHYLGGASGGFTMDSIGADGTGGNYFLDGSMDEISIWDSSLTSAQVIALYSNGRPIKLHDPPFNPIAWYRMGDNAVFKDPQWLLPENSNKDKVSNYSLEFDGTNDYVNVPPNSSIYPTTALAISMWVKLDVQTGAGPYIISGGLDGGTGPNKGYAIHLHSSGVHFRLGNGSANTLNSGDVVVGVWTHLLCNYNGTEMQTWVNGVTEGTTITVSSPIVYDLTQDLYMGTRYLWGSHIFTGNLDEIAIFNTDQSSNISFIYSGGTNGTPPDLSSLNPVGYWKMGENATYKYPQWLLPNNENKDKESKYSLLFDGTNDYIDAGAYSGIVGTDTFSISMWVKMPSGGGGYVAAIGNYASYWGFNFQFSVSPTTISVINAANGAFSNTGLSLATDTWMSVIMVQDRDVNIPQLDRCKIYIDGSIITNVTNTPFAQVSNTSPGPLTIGVRLAGTTSPTIDTPFEGNIDEVSIWSNALTSGEANTIGGGGAPTDLTGETGLINWWRMGDLTYSAGTADIWVVPDSSINNNTGFAANMTLDARVGDAPNSINNALSLNMEIFDRVGDAPSSANNALSYNMELSGRTTDVPT